MDILTTAAQLILAAVAFWYAFETRRLRIQNDAQMSLLREQLAILKSQAKSASAPSFLMGLLPTDGDVKFSATIDNYSDRTAQQVRMWLYDSSTRSYLKSDMGQQIIGANATDVTFDFTGGYLSRKELEEAVHAEYGGAFGGLIANLAPDTQSLIALTYMDVSQQPILATRPFAKVEGEFKYDAGQVFYAEP